MKQITFAANAHPTFIIFCTAEDYMIWHEDEYYEHEYYEITMVGTMGFGIHYPVDKIERLYRYDGGESYAVRLYGQPIYNARVHHTYPKTNGLIYGWAVSHRYFEEVYVTT